MLLAAYVGQPTEALELIAVNSRDAIARGDGLGLHNAYWATAILHNGLGHYSQALAAAEDAVQEELTPFVAASALQELIEAAARGGDAVRGADALRSCRP